VLAGAQVAGGLLLEGAEALLGELQQRAGAGVERVAGQRLEGVLELLPRRGQVVELTPGDGSRLLRLGLGDGAAALFVLEPCPERVEGREGLPQVVANRGRARLGGSGPGFGRRQRRRRHARRPPEQPGDTGARQDAEQENQEQISCQFRMAVSVTLARTSISPATTGVSGAASAAIGAAILAMYGSGGRCCPTSSRRTTLAMSRPTPAASASARARASDAASCSASRSASLMSFNVNRTFCTCVAPDPTAVSTTSPTRAMSSIRTSMTFRAR